MDVWAESDDEDEQTPAARDERKLREKHYNEGYKESLEKARDGALQGGFGTGFREGFNDGLRAGKLIGIVSTLQDVEPGQFNITDAAALQSLVDETKDLTKQKSISSEEFLEKLDKLERRLNPVLPAVFQQLRS